jgi:acyl-CoA thioesterase-1
MNKTLYVLRHCSLLLATFLLAALLPIRLAAAQANQAPAILIVGDSISAEYGLKRGTGWVPLLQQRLDKEGAPGVKAGLWRVVNASISGDTTAGGRSRIQNLINTHRPKVVVIELGGNDALRGLPVKEIQENLKAMIAVSKKAKAKVVLVGMQMPPNYGPAYADAFKALYAEMARTHKTGLVPFLFAGIGDVPQASSYFQTDRIHPNELAQSRLLDNVWPALEQQLKTIRQP